MSRHSKMVEGKTETQSTDLVFSAYLCELIEDMVLFR